MWVFRAIGTLVRLFLVLCDKRVCSEKSEICSYIELIFKVAMICHCQVFTWSLMRLYLLQLHGMVQSLYGIYIVN